MKYETKFAILLFALMSLCVAGCKAQYGNSSGDHNESNNADDGSVVNNQPVSVGGDIGVDDQSDLNSVSDGQEVLPPEPTLALCDAGFLWKPESEDGGLAILFPDVCPEFVKACVFVAENGDEECSGVYSEVEGVTKFLFDEDGQNYTGDIVTEDEQGVMFHFSVADPSVRNDV